jgi:nucleotide-binding universal stress UspA family protein
MRPKTILVCLTTREHAETLMAFAVPLARTHDAHLVGLHTVEALVFYPGIAMHIPEPAFEAFNASQGAESEAIEEVFRRHTQAEDFPNEFRTVRAEAISAAERTIESARAADIVVMAQADRVADRFDQRHAQVQVIRDSGRPVIVVPPGYDGPPIGKHLLLGWSDTREAARAVHDALTLAEAGATVTVLRVTEDGQDAMKDSAAIEIAAMLARHGLQAELEERPLSGARVSDVLLKTALEKGADIVVTGAFGHSRIYDFVIGATSYALLDHATVPVLFSK